MPGIMRSGGRIVRVRGRIARNRNCCCEPQPPQEVGCVAPTCFCCAGSLTPSKISVAIQGLIPGPGATSCPSCSSFNTTWTLPLTSFCGWYLDLTPYYACRRTLASEVFKYWGMWIEVALGSVDDTHCRFDAQIAWSAGGIGSQVYIRYRSAVLEKPIDCLNIDGLPLFFLDHFYPNVGASVHIPPDPTSWLTAWPCVSNHQPLLLSALPTEGTCP